MLGSAAEAEDILQDVWVRWQTTDRGRVKNPAAFMPAATTRLAINVMQSARARREMHVLPGRPDPVDTSADPCSGAERREALNVAVLLLLEKLSPTEREAYVLRMAVNYSYRTIADIIRVKEANARQLVTRPPRRKVFSPDWRRIRDVPSSMSSITASGRGQDRSSTKRP